MNEDDVLDELEVEAEVEAEELPVESEGETEAVPTPVEDLINYIDNSEYNKAEDQFKDLIGDRLQTALDQARARIAGQYYNNEPDAEEEQAELESEEQTA